MQNTKILKAGISYVVSKFGLRAINIFTIAVFTRILSTSDFGIASNFTAWLGIISVFTGVGLATTIIKGYSEYEETIDELVSSTQSLGSIITIFFIILIVLNINFISEIMHLDKYLIWFMMITLFFYQSLIFKQTQFRFEYKYKKNIILNLVISIFSIGLSFLFIYLFSEHRYIGRILGTTLPLLILGVIFWVKIFLKGKMFFNKEYWLFALKLSIPLIPHSLSMLLLSQIDRVMITTYNGEEFTGLYAFGYTYAILIGLFTNSINEATQPAIYSNLKYNNKEKVNIIVHYSNLAVLFISLMIIGIAPEIFRILAPEMYLKALGVVVPVVIGSVFQLQYQNFACVEIHNGKTKYMAIGSVIAAIINIVLNIIFIPKYGFIAAAYTTLVGYLWLMIFHFYSAKKAHNENIFNIKQLFVILSLLLIFGFFLQIFYNFWLIRYLFLIIITLILFKKYKSQLFEYLKKRLVKKGVKNA